MRARLGTTLGLVTVSVAFVLLLIALAVLAPEVLPKGNPFTAGP